MVVIVAATNRELAEEGRRLVLGDPDALETVSSVVRTEQKGDVFVEVNGKRYRVITSGVTPPTSNSG